MSTARDTAARLFMELADAVETGKYGKKTVVAVTGVGSEHGEREVLGAALLAARDGIGVIYVGTLASDAIKCVPASTEAECAAAIAALLRSGAADAAVTMHHPFPIGVSTVGRIAAPATGREMLIACTTGASATDRPAALVKNAVYGIVTARVCGIIEPTVGLLNIDGAHQAEAALKKLSENGFPICFAQSSRADGGPFMRGNDVLRGTPDVLVCDALTGNIIMKMLSAYSTGGSLETVGSGYGPGVGDGVTAPVMIVSRASGAPVITGAIKYAAQLVAGGFADAVADGLKMAEKAGLSSLCQVKKSEPVESAAKPKAEPVPSAITGVEVMDIEDAAALLWKNNIYAESGMGCTGPVVMVSDANREAAENLLRQGGYLAPA